MTLADYPPRYQAVLRILARLDGARNADIAAELGITAGTVKMYVSHILDHVDVRHRNRTALSAVARELVLHRVGSLYSSNRTAWLSYGFDPNADEEQSAYFCYNGCHANLTVWAEGAD
jgi:DNA-binding CsgD family transcriptional regulator